MYIPTSFKEKDPAKLLQIMHENAFATIVTTDSDGSPVATSLPFLIKQQNDEVILQAHFAKMNPQWKQLEQNARILVIFNGAHCYISPSWYKNAGVPTWNYVSVHAYGSAKLFDTQKTAMLIEELSNKYEEERKNPWQAQGNYDEILLNNIVGFEITVQSLQGKVKISQNKSKEDLIGVINALENSSTEDDRSIAQLIKNHLNTKD